MRLIVISTGTIFPLSMWSCIRAPSLDPLSRSFLSKSPAEKCMKPYSYRSQTIYKRAPRLKAIKIYDLTSTILAHCVPLPAPGPPSTNTTIGLTAAITCTSLVSGRVIVNMPSSTRAPQADCRDRWAWCMLESWVRNCLCLCLLAQTPLERWSS